MKKIFTLISLFVLALGVQAQTLINYPTSQTGVAVKMDIQQTMYLIPTMQQLVLRVVSKQAML